MTRGRKPGYHHTEETKQKMRLKKLGTHQSEEHRQHMYEAKRGKKPDWFLSKLIDSEGHWVGGEEND